MADFIRAGLGGSRFERVDLSGAELFAVDLAGARFRGTVDRARRLLPVAVGPPRPAVG